MIAARIAAVTRHHARARALTDAKATAALTELAEVADGRSDLPAQHADCRQACDRRVQRLA